MFRVRVGGNGRRPFNRTCYWDGPIDKVTEPIEVPSGLDPEQVPLGDRKNMAYSGKLFVYFHCCFCLLQLVFCLLYRGWRD